MLKDLFINMTILISFISLGSQIVKNYKFDEKLTYKSKIIVGIISGLLGSILMMFSIRVSDSTTILDYRNMAILLSAVLGGPVSVIISGTIISIFRITYFGINMSSILAVTAILLNSIGCLLIFKIKISTGKKWALETLLVLITASLILFILLKDKADFLLLMFIYWASHCIVSGITYFYVDYSLATYKLYRTLIKESCKDYLTGLNNVRQFHSIFNNSVKKAQKQGEELSILLFDIDFFKSINDTYGHLEGDNVLKELGRILLFFCKTGDEVFRNGGEEFSMLLHQCSNSEAFEIAERIRHYIENHPFRSSTGSKIKLTISIGIATYPTSTRDINKLVEIADNALYKAKNTGRNKVCSSY